VWHICGVAGEVREVQAKTETEAPIAGDETKILAPPLVDARTHTDYGRRLV
jgi:hypothetical protein